MTEIESLVEKVLSASCERHEIIAPCYSAPLSPPLKPVLLLSLFPIILPRRKHTHTRICALVCCCFLLMTQACHIFSGYLVDGGGRSTSGAFFDGDSWRNREASVNGRDVAHQEDLVPPQEVSLMNLLSPSWSDQFSSFLPHKCLLLFFQTDFSLSVFLNLRCTPSRSVHLPNIRGPKAKKGTRFFNQHFISRY